MYNLVEVEWDAFATEEMRSWADSDISTLMDLAEKSLKESCERLRLDVTCLRKTRAVGCYPKQVGHTALAPWDTLVKLRAAAPFGV